MSTADFGQYVGRQVVVRNGKGSASGVLVAVTVEDGHDYLHLDWGLATQVTPDTVVEPDMELRVVRR